MSRYRDGDDVDSSQSSNIETFYGSYTNLGYHASGQGSITINNSTTNRRGIIIIHSTINPLAVFSSVLRILLHRFAIHTASFTLMEALSFILIIGALTIRIPDVINVSEQRSAYVVHRRGEWLSIPARKHVHVEVVPFAQGEAFSSYFESVCYRPKQTDECFSFQNMLAFRPNTYTGSTTTNLLTLTSKLFFIRFGFSTNMCDNLIALLGYALMQMPIYLLFYRSRALGFSFFLPLAVLSSSVLSFLIALPLARALEISIDPVILPLLMYTIDFNNNPLRLSRAVFLHPHFIVPPSLFRDRPPTSLSHTQLTQLKPASLIITESLSNVYARIFRDYTIGIVLFGIGAFSSIQFSDLCALTVLILAINFLLTVTYFAAILGVMVEVRRVKLLKKIKTTRDEPLSSPAEEPIYFTLLLSFLGRKGADLPFEVKRGRIKIIHRSMSSNAGKIIHRSNAFPRLKLLLIGIFLILHILNLILPSRSLGLHSKQSPIVDVTSPSVRIMLNALAEAEGVRLAELYVRVHPPAQLQFFSSRTPSPLLAMSILSILLNGYLLRGVMGGFVRSAKAWLGIVSETHMRKRGQGEGVKVMPHSSPEDLNGQLEPRREHREGRIPSVLSQPRSLEECVEILKNGPRSLSLNMELFTDEEIDLLAQNGKITVSQLP